MGERAGRRCHRQEQEEPDGAKAPRQRAAERQQPQHVEAEMSQIGVQQRIGDEGPDLGPGAAGDLQIEQGGIVALRDEAEDVDGPVLEFRRQQHPQMDHRQQDDIGGQRRRQRQHRLVRSLLMRAFSGITVGLFGAAIGIHWSLGLSAALLLALLVVLQRRATRPA